MRFKLLVFFICISNSLFSQEVDSLSFEKEKKLELSLEILSRYIWRGQSWGGNYIAVQPSIEYEIVPDLTLGFWATTNFKGDYFYPDGVTASKGYQEIDFSVAYQISKVIECVVADYYWPTVIKVDSVDNSFFNYGKDGVKTIDLSLNFDFSEKYEKYPFMATISTLVAGNDYRYDSNGENPKQNFTTYLEIGYKSKFFKNSVIKEIQDIEFEPAVGVVLNNKAEYYSYADYDKPSLINIGIKATKEIDLGYGITMPVSLNYIHNAATKNTETFGKNFVVLGISFEY
jgi:hypothetical protein